MKNTLQNNSQSLLYLQANKLTADDLTKEVEYLILNFLVKESLNVFFAKAGQGKSWLMLSLATTLLKSEKIGQCFYLDMDNSMMALKSRKLNDITEQYPDLFYIHSSKIDESPRSILERLSYDASQNKGAFEDTLFIFDSIRDFMGGRDMNSDRDILPLMAELKTLREAGATVIFLHHTTKESDGQQFKGSTSFIDSVDVAYALSSTRSGNKLSYTLNVHKDRLSVDNSAFELNTETMTLTSENMQLARMSENEANFTLCVTEVLQSNTDGLTQSNLLQAIGKNSNDKTARKYLKKFSGEMWRTEKRAQENNATYYFPLDAPNLPNLPTPIPA